MARSTVLQYCSGWGRCLLTGVLVLGLSLVGVQTVCALDIFTLWRQPEIPLRISEGDWADYRSQTLAGGRRQEGLTRIVCLDRDHGSDDTSWLLEILPLVEDGGATHPVPGEGVQLRLSRKILNREGAFLDMVVGATRWQDGLPEPIAREDLRENPLVSASLAADFRPDTTSRENPTTRIVGGVQFLCDQFLMAAADTQTASLPAGRMIQITTREIVAAVHADVPFLGLTYVSERERSDSRLDPPSRRFKAPPARIRVEVMELVAFGHGALPVLNPVD